MEESGELCSDFTRHEPGQHQWSNQPHHPARPNRAMLSRCQSSSIKRNHSSYSQRVQLHRPAGQRAQNAIGNNPKSQLDRYVIDGKFDELGATKQRNSRLRTIDGCRQRRQHLVKANAQPFPINVD